MAKDPNRKSVLSRILKIGVVASLVAAVAKAAARRKGLRGPDNDG